MPSFTIDSPSSNGRTIGSEPINCGSNPYRETHLSLKLQNDYNLTVYYSYILLSSKSHIFYYGFTKDLKNRFELHNSGKVFSTKPHIPWKLVWYGAFRSEQEAKDFEQYLKSGSGKAFAYKRLISEALKKDTEARRIRGIPKP